MDVTSFDSTPTFFGVLEEVRNERFLGLLHQLDNTFLDGIFVLVEPAVGVVLDLYSCTHNINNHGDNTIITTQQQEHSESANSAKPKMLSGI